MAIKGRRIKRIRAVRISIITTLILTIIFTIVIFMYSPLPDKEKISQLKQLSLYNLNYSKQNYLEDEANDLLKEFNKFEQKNLGENGEKAFLKKPDKYLEKNLFDQHGYNALLSNYISVNRTLPDIRYPGCIAKQYRKNLPKVSIIMPFNNEHWSVLLRSCYSILNRSPEELIEEIILVNDFSDKEFLNSNFINFVTKNLPKVRIIHLSERSGLIRARLAGAKLARGEVLIFLDSHIEANVNWLPPLLDPIAFNSKASVCPFIDVIDYNTFEYRAQDEGARGAFDWKFNYKRLPLLPENLIDRTKPFKSPIMAGGLFAISAKFFWELDGYDEGLDIWGGEQYELSFKIWMCGGELLDAPCSRVGHIYRSKRIIKNPIKSDYLYKNYKRVAEVWMDEYKQYLYKRNLNRYKNIDPGDLTKQKAKREELKCKSFKWFIENIAFDLPKAYPFLEPLNLAEGTIQNNENKNFCLDNMGSDTGKVGLFYCAKDLIYPQDNQYWALSIYKDIHLKRKRNCLDVSESSKNASVILYPCHRQQGNQLWTYDYKNKWLIHGKNMRCLEANIFTKTVYVNTCDKKNKYMKWNFGFVNKTAIINY